MYRLLRTRKGLGRPEVAARVGDANRAAHKRSRDRPKKFAPQFLGDIERGKRRVPEQAAEGQDSIRHDLDLILALGDEQEDDEQGYALGWLGEELTLVEPAAYLADRDVADATALLLNALGRRVGVVPVWKSYVDAYGGTTISDLAATADYLGAVDRAGGRGDS